MKFKWTGQSGVKDLDLVLSKIKEPDFVLTKGCIIDVPDDMSYLIESMGMNGNYEVYVEQKITKTSKKDKKGKEELEFATVQVPSVLPRIVQLPDDKNGNTVIILLEEIIERNIEKLFLSNQVVCTCPYRIMRNADLTIDEDEAADLLKEIQKQLKKRQWGEVIRLEVEERMDERLLEILEREFKIKDEDIFKINGPLDLTFLMKMYGLEGFDGILHLKSFGCTPEISAMSIMPFISDEYGIPIIYMSFDAEDNEVGVDTRLEAFYDMIKMKRKQT